MNEGVLPALVSEAMRRTSLVWLAYADDGRQRPVWHAWDEGIAYVVSGGPEQPLPGILDVDRVVVTTRAKETGDRLVSFVAHADTLVPWTEEWQVAVEALRPARLNAAAGAALAEVWAAESTVTRLTPTGELVEPAGSYAPGSPAAPAADSPATTAGPRPWVAHRRTRGAHRL